MRIRHALIALFCVLVCTVAVIADTLTLKDGTVLEGKVIEQGDKYWIKLATGESKLVPKSNVKKFEKGDAAPKTGTGGASSGGLSPAGGKNSGGSSFSAVKSRADRVSAPIQAIQLWDQFIESKPKAADLDLALAEKAKWEKLSKDNAERIKGQWVGGLERKKIVKQAKSLVREGVKQIEEGQSAVGFKKIEEAAAVYPQSFEANFHLGLYYLKKSTIGNKGRGSVEYLDKSIRALEGAANIAPKSSSCWSNLAIGYAFKNRHQDAVKAAYKAATMHESEATVQNLMSAIYYAPRGMRDQAWCKPIYENAVLMAQRHQVKDGGWLYVPPVEGEEIPSGDNPAGTVWSGSGFFVTADGYIVTNHHVATGDPKTPIKPEIGFRIRMDDGTEKTAELIAVDDAADIALMKIVPDKPVVPMKVASYLPAQGSDLLALGYPATGDDEHTMQISHGNVKSTHEADEHEVWMDLNTTHGNSGGPIVDANNYVVSIVTAYRVSYNMQIFLGVSTHQIKTFLDKVGDKAPKLEYVDLPAPSPTFDTEKLTKQGRVSTVLILAIRNAE